VFTEQVSGVVAIYMVDDVFKAPLERAYEAVIISLMIPALAPVHVVLPEHDARSYGKSAGKVKAEQGAEKQEQVIN
jgi:hypothetical protein